MTLSFLWIVLVGCFFFFFFWAFNVSSQWDPASITSQPQEFNPSVPFPPALQIVMKLVATSILTAQLESVGGSEMLRRRPRSWRALSRRELFLAALTAQEEAVISCSDHRRLLKEPQLSYSAAVSPQARCPTSPSWLLCVEWVWIKILISWGSSATNEFLVLRTNKHIAWCWASWYMKGEEASVTSMEHSSSGLETERWVTKECIRKKRWDLKSWDKVPQTGDTGEDRASKVTRSRSHWSQNLGGKQTSTKQLYSSSSKTRSNQANNPKVIM